MLSFKEFDFILLGINLSSLKVLDLIDQIRNQFDIPIIKIFLLLK